MYTNCETKTANSKNTQTLSKSSDLTQKQKLASDGRSLGRENFNPGVHDRASIMILSWFYHDSIMNSKFYHDLLSWIVISVSWTQNLYHDFYLLSWTLSWFGNSIMIWIIIHSLMWNMMLLMRLALSWFYHDSFFFIMILIRFIMNFYFLSWIILLSWIIFLLSWFYHDSIMNFFFSIMNTRIWNFLDLINRITKKTKFVHKLLKKSLNMKYN